MMFARTSVNSRGHSRYQPDVVDGGGGRRGGCGRVFLFCFPFSTIVKTRLHFSCRALTRETFPRFRIAPNLINRNRTTAAIAARRVGGSDDVSFAFFFSRRCDPEIHRYQSARSEACGSAAGGIEFFTVTDTIPRAGEICNPVKVTCQNSRRCISRIAHRLHRPPRPPEPKFR